MLFFTFNSNYTLFWSIIRSSYCLHLHKVHRMNERSGECACPSVSTYVFLLREETSERISINKALAERRHYDFYNINYLEKSWIFSKIAPQNFIISCDLSDITLRSDIWTARVFILLIMNIREPSTQHSLLLYWFFNVTTCFNSLGSSSRV
jgi:hypothetical protein